MVDTEVKVEVFNNFTNIHQIMNSYGSKAEGRYFFNPLMHNVPKWLDTL